MSVWAANIKQEQKFSEVKENIVKRILRKSNPRSSPSRSLTEWEMLQLFPEDLANQRNRAPPVRGAAGQPLLQTIPGPTQEWASISLQVVGLSESIKALITRCVDWTTKPIAEIKACCVLITENVPLQISHTFIIFLIKTRIEGASSSRQQN